MFLTAAELHALAPFGATIRFTDGTPKPPERFNKKLAAWKRNNALGVYCEAKDADTYGATFTLETIRAAHFRSRSTHHLEGPLRYEIVRLPAPFVVVQDTSSIAKGWMQLKDGTAQTLDEAEALKSRHEAASRAFPLKIVGVTDAIRAALTESAPA